jgi:predicted dienelactone hydrolase
MIPRPTGNRIDGTWPGAPPLAGFGPMPVGVRTLTLKRDWRPITVELWYPAAPGTRAGGSYRTLLRDGVTPITLHGRAARRAAVAEGAFPLVILSHGYPGNRMLLSHLGEALASRGYIVAAADHPGSTYEDKASFAETLMHRPLDQAFVLAALMDHPDWAGHLLPRAAVVGYSMGAYGAMVFGGAGLSEAAMAYSAAPEGFARHRAGTEAHRGLTDPRLRAVVPIGLWGGQHGFWDAGTLAAWRLPCLLIGGQADKISGWDPGIRSVFEGLRGADQWLLTFAEAGHNAGAPIPAPEEAWLPSPALDFLPAGHYAEPLWDSLQMNAATQAVIAGFLARHLKDEAVDFGPETDPGAGAASGGRPRGFGPEWERLTLEQAKSGGR